MSTPARIAPGAPGQPGHWAAGAKDGVGTSLDTASPVWFTLSHGILTEVYFPFVDSACIRDLQFLVADRRDFFAEEKRDTIPQVKYLERGVPAYQVTTTCKKGRFRIEKAVLADPRRPAVLLKVRFEPLQGSLTDLVLCVQLNPHLGNQAAHNNAWVGDFKGVPMLLAERTNGVAVALACSAPWRKRSAGYVGTSDAWQDLSQHKEMQWDYERADDGNVALAGEIDLAACQGEFVLALGFGFTWGQAGHRARAGLLQGFEDARQEYVRGWREWHKEVVTAHGTHSGTPDLDRISAMIIRVHEAKYFPGGIIASLAVPWGESKQDDDFGYHLIWPRDMIETVSGQLAVQKHEDARRVLFYFEVTQDPDGKWPQNMFVDGQPSWTGVQLDEISFVILLVSMSHRLDALTDDAYRRLWPMVRSAAGYLVRHGPVTPMDRWEEKPGYYVSTLAVEIPALLCAADLAETCGEAELAGYLRETADAWNDAIERLLYVTGTELARQAGVDGYYARLALPDQMAASSPAQGAVDLPNHGEGKGHMPVAMIVSPDALCLVRYGLRAADDPRIRNTVRVIDSIDKVETPHGPCWRRYNNDGYGEHADGSPYDGTGIGRAWPLLTGERAHYELAAGRRDEAERLMRAMEGFANESGMIPEQVWDTQDIPEHELYLGRPSGSAMPLVWAHSEYIKLRRSLQDGRVYDMPPETVERYLKRRTHATHIIWRPKQPWRAVPAGKAVRVTLDAPTTVTWTTDGWKTTHQLSTRDSGLGVHYVDLPTQALAGGAPVAFRWDGQEASVQVGAVSKLPQS